MEAVVGGGRSYQRGPLVEVEVGNGGKGLCGRSLMGKGVARMAWTRVVGGSRFVGTGVAARVRTIDGSCVRALGGHWCGSGSLKRSRLWRRGG